MSESDRMVAIGVYLLRTSAAYNKPEAVVAFDVGMASPTLTLRIALAACVDALSSCRLSSLYQ